MMRSRIATLFLVLVFSLVSANAGAASGVTGVARLDEITAVACPPGLNRIAWDPVNGAEGYFVYRSASPEGIFSRLTADPIKETSFDDHASVGGTGFWYKVGWIAMGKESISSPAPALPFCILRFADRNGGAFTAVAQRAKGGYALIGRGPALASGAKGRPSLILTDESGNITLQSALPALAEHDITSIVQAVDGGFLLLGSAPSLVGQGNQTWLGKIDAQGHSLWERRFTTVYVNTPCSIVSTRDGGAVIFGGGLISYGGGSAYVVKVDGNGALLWAKEYCLGSNIQVNGLAQTTDNGYALCGIFSPPNSEYSQAFVMRLTSNGDVIWRTNIESVEPISAVQRCSADAIVQLLDGGFAVVGTTFAGKNGLLLLCKIQPDGKLAWQKIFDNPRGEMRPRGMVQDSAGDLFVCGPGAILSASEFQAWLARFSPTGDMKWRRAYNQADTYGVPALSAFGFLQPNGGGVVICRHFPTAQGELAEILALPKTGVLPGASFTQTAYQAATSGGLVATVRSAVAIENEDLGGAWQLRDTGTPLAFPGPSTIVRTFTFGNDATQLGYTPPAEMQAPVQVDGMLGTSDGTLLVHDPANERVIQLDEALVPTVSKLPLGDISFGDAFAMDGRIIQGAQDGDGSFTVVDPTGGVVLFHGDAAAYPFPSDPSHPKYYAYGDDLLIGELDVSAPARANYRPAHQYWLFSLEVPLRPGARATYRNHDGTLAFIRAHEVDRRGLWVNPEGMLMDGERVFTRNPDLLLRLFKARNIHLSGPAYTEGASRLMGFDRDGNYYLLQSNVVRAFSGKGDVLGTVLLNAGSCGVAVDADGVVFELVASPARGLYSLVRHERTWGYRSVAAVVAQDGVKLRRFPLESSPSLADLPRGAAVTVQARWRDRSVADSPDKIWYRIKLPEGLCGWVVESLLNVSATVDWEASP